MAQISSFDYAHQYYPILMNGSGAQAFHDAIVAGVLRTHPKVINNKERIKGHHLISF